MASDAGLPPERSTSEESAFQSPGGLSLLPPSPSKASPSAPTSNELQAVCKPGASSFSAPSASGPLVSQHWAAVAQPAIEVVPVSAQAGSPPPALQSSQSDRLVPCDLSDVLDERRLLAHLHLAQDREKRLWRGGKPQVLVPRVGPFSPADRLHPQPRSGVQNSGGRALHQVDICNAFERIVLWLLKHENIFRFSQTTFNLALTIFHRLLVSVKIKERLLQIVTITSLRLAVKMNEEEELIPHIKDFIKHYGSGYTPNELLKMELAILDRLHWDLHIGTPLDFLTIFHALVVLSRPHVVELLPQRNPSLHVASLTRQLQHCMAGHQLLQFKGSTLALVIITLELERLMPDWWTPISDLLKKAQVDINFVPGLALSFAPLEDILCP
ncbi:cyclin-I2 [Sciurus carolinensis]|uniref:cyclin-I2 n=1 Tax=Sciurus carolinensis TaxID=30640 RepID=UPI001FB43837|nr:cyclin-I2 [Sciurus carolinensis]